MVVERRSKRSRSEVTQRDFIQILLYLHSTASRRRTACRFTATCLAGPSERVAMKDGGVTHTATAIRVQAKKRP